MDPDDAILGPGLGESRKTILELLKRRGESTLAELEAGLELARETIRDHLAALSAQRLVERAGVRREGPGRPHVVYRLSTAAEDLFPRREGELLRELAVFLLETGHHGLLAAFLEQRGRRKRDELRRRVAGRKGAERLAEVARILSEEGFMAETGASETGPCLRLCHCPLRDLVAVSQLPCAAEMALVEDLLGETLERVSFMPDGGHTCTYSLIDRREVTQ